MKALFFVCLLLGQLAWTQVRHLKPGPLKTGFVSITRFDSERPPVKEQASAGRGRLVQINTWFPSLSKGKRMTFADYVQLAGLELDPAEKGPLQKGINRYFEWPSSLGADKKSFLEFLKKKAPMLSLRGAKMKGDHYPVVLLVHGFAADHAYLAEYIASHGYIVLQVPVKGTNAYELDYEGNGLGTQVADYEFALEILQREFRVSPKKLAAVGFSFGGQSAVALAFRNSLVKAVVSLDGGIGSAFGAGLLSRVTEYEHKKITAPILHLYNAADQHTDLGWFGSITRADRFLVAMKNMQHGHFTSFGLLEKELPGIMGKNIPSPGNGYEAMILLTTEFINAHMKDGIASRDDFLETQKTKEPWVAECMLKVEARKAAS